MPAATSMPWGVCLHELLTGQSSVSSRGTSATGNGHWRIRSRDSPAAIQQNRPAQSTGYARSPIDRGSMPDVRSPRQVRFGSTLAGRSVTASGRSTPGARQESIASRADRQMGPAKPRVVQLYDRHRRAGDLCLADGCSLDDSRAAGCRESGHGHPPIAWRTGYPPCDRAWQLSVSRQWMPSGYPRKRNGLPMRSA